MKRLLLSSFLFIFLTSVAMESDNNTKKLPKYGVDDTAMVRKAWRKKYFNPNYVEMLTILEEEYVPNEGEGMYFDCGECNEKAHSWFSPYDHFQHVHAICEFCCQRFKDPYHVAIHSRKVCEISARVEDDADQDRLYFSDDECCKRFFYCDWCCKNISMEEEGGLRMHRERVHDGLSWERKEGREFRHLWACVGICEVRVDLGDYKNGYLARHADLMRQVVAARRKQRIAQSKGIVKEKIETGERKKKTAKCISDSK